ncbi:hypothetical protein [Kribbella jiaozuonensis]|uniref:Uncharacterized protein n=1 Tax=Kribbella jiaozuonensis TaxID=2575441 RepID=A0A4U3LLR0_9ACTN|nr:hypothetical protein [Kribbella jiaozuonensis]TKK76661.1 hypothetical protein FDA38_30380 [Kribbella jiaozuonensis]
MTPRAERREPSRDELAAAQQVVGMFATEALLALDRYERSFPAAATDRERQVADRLAHWWRRLELDGVRLDPEGTDAEQILVAAADLSLDPRNQWGLSLEEASAQAVNRAALEGRPMPATSVADLRKSFEDAYGDRVVLPERDDDWLAQSLTRLARASVLRDVIDEGAQVRVGAPLRQAADEMVRQGRQLMDDRLDLARRQEAPVSRRAAFMQQARLTSTYALYSLGVDLTGAPDWADVALKVPAFALYLKESRDAWRDHSDAVATRLDPAQAQLRSVRNDLLGTLATDPPTTRRDNRALRNATNRRPTQNR